MVNILAENGVDCGEIALSERPAAHFPDRLKLIRAACPPQRDTNAGLIKEPADREVNHALAKVFPGECIQLACCIEVFGEMRWLKLGVGVLPHVTDGKLAIEAHCSA